MSGCLWRRAAAEAIGTALLLATVVGSGIMAERLSGGNAGLALLANALATAGALYVLIEWFGPVSGAHFNPAVTFAMAVRGDIGWDRVPLYVLAQTASAVLGVGLADLMFDLAPFSWSQHARTGTGQILSEGVATFGLVGLILALSQRSSKSIPACVGAYIGAAYWFTASTSFANPAVTLARAMTDTFAGIRLTDVPAFVAAQSIGTILAIAVGAWMFAPTPREREASGKMAPGAGDGRPAPDQPSILETTS